jgi:hypothetical protein
MLLASTLGCRACGKSRVAETQRGYLSRFLSTLTNQKIIEIGDQCIA